MRVASRFSERLKTEDLTKIGNIKNLEVVWKQSLVPSLHFRNKTLVITAENYGEKDIVVF